MASEKQRELELLEALEEEPETSQADLAVKVGVAVGTVNWYLKRWAAKGYVKIIRIGRWHWRYLLTPQGIAQKARLAGEYLEASFALYRRTRAEAKNLLHQVRAAGYTEVSITGSGDLAEIAELTCLELGLKIVPNSKDDTVPVLKVTGTRLELVWAESDSNDSSAVASADSS